jgi:RHS repeat-associated protein
VSNGVSTTEYRSFDAFGRATTSRQTVGGQSYDFTYTYNRAGALTSEAYPSGRIVSTSFDGANRASSVSGSFNSLPTTYASGIAYAPHGGFAAYTMGNQVQRLFSYTSHLQMAGVKDTWNGATLFQLDNSWASVRGNGNNGNLYDQTIVAGGLTFNQHFTYDTLNRVSSAQEGNHWLRNFDYDAFGNMYLTSTGGLQPSPFMPNSSAWFDSKNRLSNAALGITYDKGATGPGNLTAIGGYTFEYDAENRQTKATINGITTTYQYDGDGHRVQKMQGSQTITYVYDAMGELAAEYHSQAADSLLCTTCYVSVDHLGSTRMMTGPQGQIIGLHDYLPFGEEITGVGGRTRLWGATDAVNQKFTAKERDPETGLDYFGARYYGSALGRWTSPDPGNAGSHPSDPQSWNAYSYVRNNPLSLTDPTGFDYSICTNDGNRGQQCSYIANDQAAEAALANPGSGLSASNGNIYSTDENGNQVQIGTYQHFLGPGDMASEGLREDYGFELGAMGLGRGIAGLFEGAAASAARSTVWSLASTVRGGVVEEMLGANLPRTFPVIDVFENGIATSIKSVDLSAASYQAPDVLASKLTSYVDKLASFSGGKLGGAVVDGANITGKVLKLAVPEGASAAQQAVISRVTAAAAQKGVQVVVVTVK